MEAEAMKFVAIGLMAFGVGGAALGVGNVFAALMNGISRNPEAEDKLSRYALIGAGMTEALGLLAVIIALVILFS